MDITNTKIEWDTVKGRMHVKYTDKPDKFHPWKDNFRDFARMLEGEIELPHAQVGKHNPICDDCTEAFIKRRDYQLKKLELQHAQQTNL